ncbi:MAG TPA: hypothetical protein VF292_07380 [Rhodanobacteraceae bacterium]
MSRNDFEKLDQQDAAILARRQAAYDELPGVRNGDFLVFRDGRIERVAHVSDNAVQSDFGGRFGSSFYLGDGYAGYSGGLDRSIPLSRVASTHEGRNGSAWFFHHNEVAAHNGVGVRLFFRVFRVAA